MPEALAQALAGPGLLLLAATAFVAGVVRGFTGFGTAMIYMPVAGQILTPVAALATMTVMDAFGPLPNVPRALRDWHRRDVVLMCATLVLALPAGLFLLTRMPVELFRYAVSLIALALLALLIAGWRYRGALSRSMIAGTGLVGGFLGGSTGLAGPPVIMLYMASTLPARVVRANLLLYLLAVDILMLATLTAMGRLDGATLATGLVMLIPYLAGNVLGGWLFRPGLETVYRRVAYVIIAASALSGLPLWD